MAIFLGLFLVQPGLSVGKCTLACGWESSAELPSVRINLVFFRAVSQYQIRLGKLVDSSFHRPSV